MVYFQAGDCKEAIATCEKGLMRQQDNLNSHVSNNVTERNWTQVTIKERIKDPMKTHVQFPPRKLQSETSAGPITLSGYERFRNVRERLRKEGVKLRMPIGN